MYKKTALILGLGITILFASSFNKPYHSVYKKKGFVKTGVLRVNTNSNPITGIENGDYYLYQPIPFIPKNTNFMFFVPNGTKKFEFNFQRVSSTGLLEGIASMLPRKGNKYLNGRKVYLNYKEHDKDILLDKLLDGYQVVYTHMDSIVLGADNIPKSVYTSNLDKWIFFIPMKIDSSITYRHLLPEVSNGGAYVASNSSNSDANSVNDNSGDTDFANLEFGLKYYFDKVYVDSYVQKIGNIPQDCIGKIDNHGNSIENICAYLYDKYKNVLYKDNKNSIDRNKFILYDYDPIIGLGINNIVKQDDNGTSQSANNTSSTQSSTQPPALPSFGGESNIQDQNSSSSRGITLQDQWQILQNKIATEGTGWHLLGTLYDVKVQDVIAHMNSVDRIYFYRPGRDWDVKWIKEQNDTRELFKIIPKGSGFWVRTK